MSGARAWLGVCVLLCCVSRSGAESVPQPGVADPRIRTALYSINQVYMLYGFVGYHLDLEFEPGESFAGLSAGDPQALTYSAHEHILSLRPRAPSAHMNVAVSTNKRRYYFDYTIFAREPERGEAMYAVRFTYPTEVTKDTRSRPDPVEVELARANVNRPRNFNYWYCGDPSVKPIAASDDGVHTRLTFAVRGELPAIFVRNADDTESLLNFSMNDGDLVIHRVAARFVVRRGKLTGCIVNKGFVGAGERLQSETLAPNVTRERKGLAP
jgi:type IV secretion system protein VirB9